MNQTPTDWFIKYYDCSPRPVEYPLLCISSPKKYHCSWATVFYMDPELIKSRMVTGLISSYGGATSSLNITGTYIDERALQHHQVWDTLGHGTWSVGTLLSFSVEFQLSANFNFTYINILDLSPLVDLTFQPKPQNFASACIFLFLLCFSFPSHLGIKTANQFTTRLQITVWKLKRQKTDLLNIYPTEMNPKFVQHLPLKQAWQWEMWGWSAQRQNCSVIISLCSFPECAGHCSV